MIFLMFNLTMKKSNLNLVELHCQYNAINPWKIKTLRAVWNMRFVSISTEWWWHDPRYDHCENWCECSWRKSVISVPAVFNFLICLWTYFHVISAKMLKARMHGHYSDGLFLSFQRRKNLFFFKLKCSLF